MFYRRNDLFAMLLISMGICIFHTAFVGSLLATTLLPSALASFGLVSLYRGLDQLLHHLSLTSSVPPRNVHRFSLPRPLNIHWYPRYRRHSPYTPHRNLSHTTPPQHIRRAWTTGWEPSSNGTHVSSRFIPRHNS